MSGQECITVQDIRRELGATNVIGRELVCRKEVSSTNDLAAELAAQGAAEGTVVLAQAQTAGRGRMGRSFHSPLGKGIYLTVLLRPSIPAQELAQITALAGISVCDAVESVCGVRPGLKWPNDPVLGGKKLCGILTELHPDEVRGGLCLLLGIGINVSQTAADFSPEVAKLAVSLEQELGQTVSHSRLAAELIRRLDEMYALLQRGETERFRAVYRRDCVNLGKPVQILGKDGREAAWAVDVDPQFGLVVRMPGGEERTLRSGEVSVRGMYGYVE